MSNLMEEICERNNLNRAYKRVKSNQGVAGFDGMKVDELSDWICRHKHNLIPSLLSGEYKPQPILGIEIPKPGNKGKRQLGIPTVVDRLVQQAIHQVLEKHLDKDFSGFSFGFRPRKSAHQAIRQAKSYVISGFTTVVDIDLCKFFDEVNHDILMTRLQRRIKDPRLLKLIGRFLRVEMVMNGKLIKRSKGMPQGGPLSPLLSNLLLDDLDKELERRGHKFCRYADDCNIYVCSQRAGERVLSSITNFLANHLKLSTNTEKSGVDKAWNRKFLGFTFTEAGAIRVAPESIRQLKVKIRRITRRNRSINFGKLIGELNVVIRGWGNYFKLSEYPAEVRTLDGYIRRKLRCFRIKQIGHGFSLYRFLVKHGARKGSAFKVGRSGKGWWCLSRTPAVSHALSNRWFECQGLINIQTLVSQ